MNTIYEFIFLSTPVFFIKVVGVELAILLIAFTPLYGYVLYAHLKNLSLRTSMKARIIFSIAVILALGMTLWFSIIFIFYCQWGCADPELFQLFSQVIMRDRSAGIA